VAPAAHAWIAAGASTLATVLVLVGIGQRRRGAPRALLLGGAAGCCYAMQASVTKVFVTLLGHGILTLVTSWTSYALVASALVGFALQQSALKTGVLAPAMGSSNAVTLFASVMLGIWVFDERLAEGAAKLPAAIGLAIAILGIALLAGAPSPAPTRTPDQGATGALDTAER